MTTKKNGSGELDNTKKSKQAYFNSEATQRVRILAEFEKKNQLSTFYFRDAGIVHPAGRIKELRVSHKILSGWTKEPDQNGVLHRIGLYTYCGLRKSVKEVNHESL